MAPAPSPVGEIGHAHYPRVSTTSWRGLYRRGAGGREFVAALLDGYTAIPEEIPRIAPMIHFIAEHDGMLDLAAYTFRDRLPVDRPAEVVLRSRPDKAPTTHRNIVEDERLRVQLAPALTALCNETGNG